MCDEGCLSLPSCSKEGRKTGESVLITVITSLKAYDYRNGGTIIIQTSLLRNFDLPAFATEVASYVLHRTYGITECGSDDDSTRWISLLEKRYYCSQVRRKSFLQASQDLRELSALVADKGAESDSKDQKIKELEAENLRLKDELATKERFHTELQKEQAREIELLKKAYEDMVMKLELALQVEQDMVKDIKALKADIDEEICLERLQLRRNNWDSDTFEFDEVLTEFASHKKTNAKTSHYFLECKNSCWILEYVLHQDIHFGTPEKEE
ncbi:hypothetical protein Tco_1386416 [Tanacetum coccineum]